MEIEYDPIKNQGNIDKRGISFELSADFDLTTALIWQDNRSNYAETRFSALGLIDNRLYALVFTPRHDRMRVISLRKANPREVRRYEQAQSQRNANR